GFSMLNCAVILSSAFSIWILCRAIVRQALARAGDQCFDSIGEMDFGDVVIVARDPDAMRFHENVGMSETGGRLEAIGRKFDQQAERIGEIDRIHEAAVLDAAMLDAALVQ